MTLNSIRCEGIWIENANAAMRNIINQCVKCCRLCWKFGNHKMADLPQE